jgi:hypothetical protein
MSNYNILTLEEEKMEQWKPIVGMNGYQVSNYGRVKGKMKTILRIYNVSGCLSIKTTKTTSRIHLLVLNSFDPIADMEKYEVLHKDKNKLNNKLDNLYYSKDFLIYDETLKHEKWVPVKNTNTYYISEFAKVYCTRNGKEIKPYHHEGRYKFDALENGVVKFIILDQAVFFSFNISIKENKCFYIKHLDDEISNCKLLNLNFIPRNPHKENKDDIEDIRVENNEDVSSDKTENKSEAGNSIVDNKNDVKTENKNETETFLGDIQDENEKSKSSVYKHTLTEQEVKSEEWKVINDYREFEISSMGRVRDSVTKEFQKRTIGDNKYLVLRLSKNSIVKPFPIHRLVLEAFSPDRREDRIHVNHKNGIKYDNRLVNLEWVTPQENSLHAVQTGLTKSEKKPVNQIDPISKKILNSFDSILEATKYLKQLFGKASGGSISKAATKNTLYKNFKWEFVNEIKETYILKQGEEMKDVYINEQKTYYKITNYGTFISTLNGKFEETKGSTSSGYNIVTINGLEKIRTERVHRLVAQCFCPNLDPVHNVVVHHKNENKLDNRASNLEWTTNSKNVFASIGSENCNKLYSELIGDD